jgi:hypothetical protein
MGCSRLKRLKNVVPRITTRAESLHRNKNASS